MKTAALTQFQAIDRPVGQEDVFGLLDQLSAFYPKFSSWYQDKVVPGILAGTRRILVRRIDGNLAAIAIVKLTDEEKKLCCLRVLPNYQGTGVGIKLFEDAFAALETDRPLLSVAEEQIPRFKRVFDHFGFELSERYRDIYRPNKDEYSFNGLLFLPEASQGALWR
jgi:GNAT superfamily N-acetyltransferase